MLDRLGDRPAGLVPRRHLEAQVGMRPAGDRVGVRHPERVLVGARQVGRVPVAAVDGPPHRGLRDARDDRALVVERDRVRDVPRLADAVQVRRRDVRRAQQRHHRAVAARDLEPEGVRDVAREHVLLVRGSRGRLQPHPLTGLDARHVRLEEAGAVVHLPLAPEQRPLAVVVEAGLVRPGAGEHGQGTVQLAMGDTQPTEVARVLRVAAAIRHGCDRPPEERHLRLLATVVLRDLVELGEAAEIVGHRRRAVPEELLAAEEAGVDDARPDAREPLDEQELVDRAQGHPAVERWSASARSRSA